MSVRCKTRNCVAVVALALLCALGAAGQKRDEPPRAKDIENWKPAYLPAQAVKFGAELDAAASPELKKWVGGYVARRMRERTVEPREVMADVDAQFAAAADEARDAVIFLVYYAAYKDEDDNQRQLAFRIRDIDRETFDLSRQINLMIRNSERRSASPNQQMTVGDRLRMDEEQRKLEIRLRELGDERQLKATQMEASRQRVTTYLRLLGKVHEKMKGISPRVLAGVK
ncbi:MAG TPA: hypothetical protein VNL38_00060 [Candidatus Nitrosotenuis sp.]|nr:hypothetical protein [Candidatus Nitrosotenuis sp.]